MTYKLIPNILKTKQKKISTSLIYARIINIFLLFILLLLSCTTKIKNSDLIFVDTGNDSFSLAIKKVTPKYNDSIHFTHVGIIIEKNKKFFVLEALPTKGVILSEINEFINRYNKQKIYIGKIKKNYFFPTMQEIQNYLGKPYDYIFNINNDSFYCSELVYFFYKEKNNKYLFNLKPMTFKDPETKNFFPIWVNYFKKFGVKIPEKMPGINPADIANSNFINLYHINKIKF